MFDALNIPVSTVCGAFETDGPYDSESCIKMGDCSRIARILLRIERSPSLELGLFAAELQPSDLVLIAEDHVVIIHLQSARSKQNHQKIIMGLFYLFHAILSPFALPQNTATGIYQAESIKNT